MPRGRALALSATAALAATVCFGVAIDRLRHFSGQIAHQSSQSCDKSIPQRAWNESNRQTLHFGERIVLNVAELEGQVLFRNPLDRPLRLLLPPPSCCLNLTADKQTVPPGGQAAIKLRMRTRPAGTLQRSVVVRTRPHGPSLTIQIKAQLYPPLKLSGPDRVTVHRGDKRTIWLKLYQYAYRTSELEQQGRFHIDGGTLLRCQLGQWQPCATSIVERLSKIQVQIEGPAESEPDAVYRTVRVASAEGEAVWPVLVEAESWLRVEPAALLLGPARRSA